jgi:hypothetical protein
MSELPIPEVDLFVAKNGAAWQDKLLRLEGLLRINHLTIGWFQNVSGRTDGISSARGVSSCAFAFFWQ